MLIVRNIEDGAAGEWFEHTVRGEVVKLKIRPMPSDTMTRIRNTHKGTKLVKNEVGKTERIDVYDDDKIGSDMIDYILEEFAEVYLSPTELLECTAENKVKLMEIPSLDDEVSISAFVFDMSKKIAAVNEAEYKEQEKN